MVASSVAVGQAFDPTAGSPTAVVGTFLVTAAFYALTAHVAARYVLGDVPVARAGAVGVVLAVVSFLLQRRSAAVVIAVTVPVDFFLIRTLYRTDNRTTALITVVHYTVFVLLGLVVVNLVVLLGTAPG
jgi:hypothetical protein